MFHRGFRGGRKRSGLAGKTSFKKVLNMVNASFSAGFQNEFLVQGEDSVAAGQTSSTDPDVPTGAIIKMFEVQFAVSNVVSTPCYVNTSLQLTHSTQTPIDPRLVGGNQQRNQVFHQQLFQVGANQSSNHKFKFKIPKPFQRVREGMDWTFTWSNTATVNREVQVIYKFYR